MQLQGIYPSLHPSQGEAHLPPEMASCCSVQDRVELSGGAQSGNCSVIPPMAHFAATLQSLSSPVSWGEGLSSQPGEDNGSGSSAIGAGSAPSVLAPLQSPQPPGKSVTVEINEWFPGKENTSYIVNTAGCGAIKIFVDRGESSYFLVFHSFGTQESMEAAADIGRYILNTGSKPEAVRILDIQPYAISPSINKTVGVIREMLEKKGGIQVDGRTICLKNIDGPMYSRFISVDLQGTEQEILDRCDHLILKSREMSDEERAQKIRLFQSLPYSVRTPEFLNKWAPLSLDEAKSLVADLRNGKKWPGSFRQEQHDKESTLDSHRFPRLRKFFGKIAELSGIAEETSKDGERK